MKTFIKSAIALAVATPMLFSTSCIEETTPTNVVTASELASSAKASEALLWEMTAIYNLYNTLNQSKVLGYDWGYPAIMHVRDVMTEDMVVTSSDYDWFSSWEQADYINSQYMSTQFIWNYMWKVVQTTNNLFAATGYESSNDAIMGNIAIASAFRASIYLDLAQMYEFLPNDKTSGITDQGHDVTHLTVPIVTQETSEEQAKDNPRVSREKMAEFILSDLDRAEENIAKAPRLSKVMPDLAVVYGLKARFYLWLENYPMAKEYAEKAIAKSGANPLTEAQWLDTKTGFNEKSVSSWLWSTQYVEEDNAVRTGILNWTSWMSVEATFGYAAAGPYVQIYKKTYDRIADTDFRKRSFKAPAGSKLEVPTLLSEKAFAKFPTYTCFKFRPGSGEINDYKVACSVAVPLMRVEEMYFIAAEAAAHSNPTEGKNLLESFMTKYRDRNYSAANAADIVEEIIFQKRVELFGEGLNFYDMKRLGYSVDRKCAGTNFAKDMQLVSNGRPAWVNFCIVQTEGNANKALQGWNNPSFDGMYN